MDATYPGKHQCPVRLSMIIATSGRSSLIHTMATLNLQSALCPVCDEIILAANLSRVPREVLTGYAAETKCRTSVVNAPFSKPEGYGMEERRMGMAFATGTHLWFLDDDDGALPASLVAIKSTAFKHPGKPLMFRMVNENGLILWVDRNLQSGNQGGPQFVAPNDKYKLGEWGDRYEGDYDFIASTVAKYPADALVWSDYLIYGCRAYGQWGSINTLTKGQGKV